MPEELPVHPVTGLTALGVLSSGRIVWPVLGAAPEDGDDTDDDSGDGDGAGADVSVDLRFEAGKQALANERKARREADRARKAAEAKAAELEAQLAAGTQQDDAKQAAEKTRRDAEAAATAKANARILRSELKAAAAGKLADPSDAAAFIDLAQFEPDADGEFDSTEIAEAISDLIKRKPHLAAAKAGFQGSGDGGARTGGSGPKQLTRADLKTMTPAQIDKARSDGRFDKLLSGG
jgi:hypothetical protein